jgi:hypothetical protein
LLALTLPTHLTGELCHTPKLFLRFFSQTRISMFTLQPSILFCLMY